MRRPSPATALSLLVLLAGMAASASAKHVDPCWLLAPQFARWTCQARVPLPSGPIRIIPWTAADSTAALAWSAPPVGGQAAEIAVGPTDAKMALYHELGHLYDWEHLTAINRRELERLMRDGGQNWDEANDPHGGAQDDFAEMYALCAEHWGRRNWPQSAWWWPTLTPTWQNVRAICRLIVRVRHQRGTMPSWFADPGGP